MARSLCLCAHTPRQSIQEPKPRYFDKLPLEVHWMIWEAIIPEPCVVVIMFDSLTGGIFSMRKPPIGFQICQSSRTYMQARSNYQLAFSTNFCQAQIYVDFIRDIIFFDPVGAMANIVSQLSNSFTNAWRAANRHRRIDLNARDLAQIKRMAVFPEFSLRPYETIRSNFPGLQSLSIVVDGNFDYRREIRFVATREWPHFRNGSSSDPTFEIVTQFMEANSHAFMRRMQREKATGSIPLGLRFHLVAIASRLKGESMYTRSFKDSRTRKWLPCRSYGPHDIWNGQPVVSDSERQMRSGLPSGWWELRRWA